MADDEHQPPPGSPADEADKNETPEEDEEEDDVCRGLVDDDSFHGLMPIEDVAGLLKTNGAYLVRNAEQNAGGRQILVSVLWNGAIREFEVYGAAEKGCSIDHVNCRPTILELLYFHRVQQIPLGPERILLVEPVLRQSWELRRDSIVQGKKLGEGAFGEVFKGTLKMANGKKVTVAIKIPKSNFGKDVVGEAMKEARIQKDYVHPNVLRLYGVSAETDPLMIVLEYVGGGSLDKHLKNFRDQIPIDVKATYCFDVTCGLDYLHMQNCIHRDIAARNCLVCVKYGVAKIADFGLSSVGNVQTLDRSKPAPIRWLAPEVLKTAQYAKTADIWSLAIVYWEIFTNALDVPFKNYTLTEVQRKLCGDVDFHPTMPLDCPSDILQLSLKCWSMDPSKRPPAAVCTGKLATYANFKRFMRIPNLMVDWKGLRKQKKRKSKKHTTTKDHSDQPRVPSASTELKSGGPTMRKPNAKESGKRPKSPSRKSRKTSSMDSKERIVKSKKRKSKGVKK